MKWHIQLIFSAFFYFPNTIFTDIIYDDEARKLSKQDKLIKYEDPKEIVMELKQYSQNGLRGGYQAIIILGGEYGLYTWP